MRRLLLVHWQSLLCGGLILALAAPVAVRSQQVLDEDADRLLNLRAAELRTTLATTVVATQSTLLASGAIVSTGASQAPETVQQNTTGFSTSRLDVARFIEGGSWVYLGGSSGSVADLATLPEAQAMGLGLAAGNPGLRIVGYRGRGFTRRLAIAYGMPSAAGVVVYAEFALPEGITSPGASGTDFAVYVPGEASPAFASTSHLPLVGRQTTFFVATPVVGGRSEEDKALRVTVALRPEALGTVDRRLPWILFATLVAIGIAVLLGIESLLRRRDEAVRLATDLDRALAAERSTNEARTRLEAELRRSSRLEAVGRLAGGVAHDFNNLLGVVLTCTGLVEDTLPPEHPARAETEQIRQASRRAADLVRHLLAFSRRDGSDLGRVDIGATVEAASPLLHRLLGERSTMTVAVADGLPPVMANVNEIEQIIVNLVANARDAMADGGRLAVSVDQIAGDGRAWVALTVADDGEGMTPDVVDRALEPFFTTKEAGGGTGLGLATVYGATTRAGGRIELRSTPGEGTVVTVLLPVAEDGSHVEVQTPTLKAATR